MHQLHSHFITASMLSVRCDETKVQVKSYAS